MTDPRLDGPAITIARAAELLHCSRARVFELLKQGRLVRAPRFGRETTIVTASVLAALRVEPPPRKPVRRSASRSMARATALRAVPLDGDVKPPAAPPR